MQTSTLNVPIVSLQSTDSLFIPHEKSTVLFSPSDFSEQICERFLPRVHLDDPDASHHFIHDADFIVSKNCCFAPAKKFNEIKW